VGLVVDNLSVYIYFGHVVDNHGNTFALAVLQHVVEQGGFARAEEAG
jgi:hypothetical protein